MGEEEKTLAEIAPVMGITSRERVRQIEKKAMRSLKCNKSIKNLRLCLPKTV